jgi:hypothetical protein
LDYTDYSGHVDSITRNYIDAIDELVQSAD